MILFQEQVLKTARDLSGFTGGQGEQLRRALGSKRASEAIDRFHEQFVEGALLKGVEQAIADAVFDSLRAFGGYSFPKSHAAAFAVLVYQSAWLKHYHPAAFYVGLLNNQPMGFWSPSRDPQRCQTAPPACAAGRGQSQREAVQRSGRCHPARLQLCQGLRRGRTGTGRAGTQHRGIYEV